MVHEAPESRQTAQTGAGRMPALFLGHGSPMNAIEDNEFSRAWWEIGRSLPPPRAVLCISAHWERDGTCVTAMDRPKTLHDFYGFPAALNEVRYPALGAPEVGRLVRDSVRGAAVGLDHEWGLDHGAWSVLCHLYPLADVPVIQLSLDRNKDPLAHYELGKELKGLRDQGVLILGSGNIVHNLRTVAWEDTAYDWAVEFDDRVKQLILARDHESLIDYRRFGQAAKLAVPTNEHYLPLLYVLAVQERDEAATFQTERVTMGSISMRSLRIG